MVRYLLDLTMDKKDSMDCCSFIVNGERPGALTADNCARLIQLHEGTMQKPTKIIASLLRKPGTSQQLNKVLR